MIDKMDSQEWSIYDRYTRELEQLQGFNEKWKADSKASDLWNNFRLLPLDVGYLIASQYGQKQGGWIFNTKWQLYKKFDTCLSMGTGSLKQIGPSIEEAVKTQKKIVVLQKVFATLQGSEIDLRDKAIQELKTENGELYSLVIKKIWEARGKLVELTQCESELVSKPLDKLAKKVFERIIDLHRDGYQNLEGLSFESVRT